MSESLATTRLQALDAQRGFIMILMAVDHASAFVARIHHFEFWGEPLPYYGAVLPFVTRWVSHLCAPGFFFLMGTGMALFGESRRRTGWSEGRITGHFVKRGIVLLIVEQIIENPAWILGAIGAAGSDGSDGFNDVPGGGGQIFLALGVLYALGGAMIVGAVLLRAATSVVATISVAAILITQLGTPDETRVAVLYAPWLRLLLIPGHTNAWFVLYPLVPWMGLTGLGIIFGQRVAAQPTRLSRSAAIAGVALLVSFAAVRLANGFGNIHTDAQPGWIGFLNVTKYPPSAAFVLVTLGVNGLLLAAFACSGSVVSRWAFPLLTFGRSPLFFYIVHLYLFALIGFAFPNGTTLPRMYLVWVAALFALYPVCRSYERFKHHTTPDSLWRLF